MTIGELRQALIEIHDFCRNNYDCYICPFVELSITGEIYTCRLLKAPTRWNVERWRKKDAQV